MSIKRRFVKREGATPPHPTIHYRRELSEAIKTTYTREDVKTWQEATEARVKPTFKPGRFGMAYNKPLK